VSVLRCKSSLVLVLITNVVDLKPLSACKNWAVCSGGGGGGGGIKFRQYEAHTALMIAIINRHTNNHTILNYHI
jgi:hypothetical protein